MERAKAAASQWLAHRMDNPDLACDVRVSVPIYFDPIARTTRFWTTLGVRLAWLQADYARAPKIRPKQQKGAWREAQRHELGKSSYVIPVVDFAEFELPGLRTLTRSEFRALCDQYKTKEAILHALGAN